MYIKLLLEYMEVLNSIGTLASFCLPFLFLKYYFDFENFEQLMNHVVEQNGTEGAKKKLKNTDGYTPLYLPLFGF